MEGIKDHLDDELKELLCENAESTAERLTKKTDEEWLNEAADRCKSPLIPLYRVMKKAEEHPSKDAEHEVLIQAIRADEFMGAFTRLSLHASNQAISTAEFFRMHYVSKMCSYQMKKQKIVQDHRIAMAPSDLLKDTENVTGPLLDPKYKTAYIQHRAELIEATQETFDKAEPTLAPLAKKAGKHGGFAAFLALIVWIIGGLLIWNTFGPVWNWAFEFIDNVFFPLILSFWVIPIVYAIIVGCLFLGLGGLIFDFFSKGANKKLETKIAELKSNAAHSVRNTEAARTVETFDQKIPAAFRDYTGHVALAAIAALTTETSMSELARRANDDSTWLTRLHKTYSTDEKPYGGEIYSLLREDIPDETDVFIAFTLLCKRKKNPHPINGSFISDFLDAEKDDRFIRGKLVLCFANFCIQTLKETEKHKNKIPGIAGVLEEFHKGNVFLNVDNNNYSRFLMLMRNNQSLIDWHLDRG